MIVCVKNSIAFPLLSFVIWLFSSSTSLAEIHGTLTISNDYIWRGYSKTEGDFALQANLDYEHASGFYLGTSVSNVDFGDVTFDDRSHVEITPYLGWTFNLSDDWRMDVQWTHYFYNGDIFGHQSDYNEYYFFLHFREIFSASVSFSEDYYNQGHSSAEYELTGRYPITDTLQFSTGIGYSAVEEVLEYDNLHWNAGLTYYYEFIALDFRYQESAEMTEPRENKWSYDPEVIEPSFVFSFSIGF